MKTYIFGEGRIGYRNIKIEADNLEEAIRLYDSGNGEIDDESYELSGHLDVYEDGKDVTEIYEELDS